MDKVITAGPRHNWTLTEFGMAVSIALAIVYGVIVADFALVMIENDADQKAIAVLGVFATPLLTSWVAIAIWLARRPLWLRWSVATLLVLGPPLILMGIEYA
jgi:hypothetical protein